MVSRWSVNLISSPSVNLGAANSEPVLQITDGTHLMAQFIDRGTTGDLSVTGDGVFGGPNSIGPRSLLVQSTEEASVNIISGASRDALLSTFRSLRLSFSGRLL